MTLHEELAKANVPGARIRAALIQKGIEAERERIIKLLEESAEWSDGWVDIHVDRLIALIKGDNE